MSWEMWRCAVLLVDTHETLWVEACKDATRNVMPFVYWESESPETPQLFFGHIVFCYMVLLYATVNVHICIMSTFTKNDQRGHIMIDLRQRKIMYINWRLRIYQWAGKPVLKKQIYPDSSKRGRQKPDW
jgi:hypothetical protein